MGKSKGPSLNIKLISSYRPKFNKIAAVTLENKSLYCARYGYTFVSDAYADNNYNNFVKHKYQLFRAHIETCDWLVWQEIDCLIMNPQIELESFIKNNCDIIGGFVTVRWGWEIKPIISTKMLFFKNTSWTINFMDTFSANFDLIASTLTKQSYIEPFVHGWDKNHYRYFKTKKIFSSVKQSGFCSEFPNYNHKDFLINYSFPMAIGPATYCIQKFGTEAQILFGQKIVDDNFITHGNDEFVKKITTIII